MFFFLKKINFLLFGIIILGFFLRIYNLDKNPVGFFCDEAFFGYNSYSIFTTGFDENGIRFPFFLKTFGEPRLPVPFYLMIPSIAFFGLNEFAVRLTPAILGTLNILLIYFIAKKLTNKSIGLISALLLAVSGWHIHFSRQGTENIFLPFFLTLSLALFLNDSKKNYWRYLLSIIFFSITLYTYSPAMLIVPLFVIAIHLIYLSSLKRRILIIGISLFTLLSIPLLSGIISGTMLSRWNNGVGITTVKQKPGELAQRFLKGYLNHFSYDYLFSKGDIDFSGQAVKRYSVKGFGMLYLFEFPILLIGILSLRRFGNRTFLLILTLLALYPLGGALTSNVNPFASRVLMGIIPFEIVTACGAWQIYNWLRKKILFRYFYLSLLSLIIIFSVISYQYKYHREYPKYSADFWGWQFGARDIVSYFKQNQNNYDELYMAPEFNAPEIFFKFYAPNDCLKCKVGLPDDRYNSKLKQLFAVPGNYSFSNKPFKLKVLKYVYYPTGKYPNDNIAFQIGEIIQ